MAFTTNLLIYTYVSILFLRFSNGSQAGGTKQKESLRLLSTASWDSQIAVLKKIFSLSRNSYPKIFILGYVFALVLPLQY